ncbi:molybdopterin-dependent oxidoreductase [Novosphingobium bradum]|uniref:Molybdopterin-dependent oxidoreductase n=1 Tax=Novosphingobium bradum TaxID=1737444 RepID=A0ABV7IPK7_9SPHN
MILKSFCRICTSNCGLDVEVEGDQVIAVRGDEDSPLTAGYTCSKGRAAGELQAREDRLLHPMIGREAGQRRATWDEALDDLAAKLNRIIAESGPDAVGIFLGGGCYLDSAAYTAQRTMREALGTRSFYSDMSIDVMSKGVVGEMVGGVACMPRPDFGRTRMIVYVGTNPVVSHGHTSMLNSPTQRLREFTANGEVWVLDARKTETAARATRHLHVKAGTDYAVLAYLIRELLRDGADREYLAAHAQDVDKLAAVVEPFTAAHVARLSGLAEDDLADFLAAVRRNGRLSVESGTGISLSPAGNLTAWMSLCLMIVTGSIDREGGAWCNPGFFLQMDRMSIPPAPPEGWRIPGPKSRPELVTVAGEFVCAAMPDEIEQGNLRAMINLSGHMLTCIPGSDRLERALRGLEVFATIEILDNSVTRLSTHALPAKHQLERPDVSLAVDPSFSEVAAYYSKACVPARGEARSYWWILAELGRRMGRDFFPGVDPATATDDEVVALIAARGRRPVDTSGQCSYTVAQERIYGWVTPNVDRIGGWRLAPDRLIEQLRQMPPAPPLVMISGRQLHQHNSRKVPHNRDVAAIFVNPEDARALGFADGERAILRSAHGEIDGNVKYDPRLVRGACHVPHGWQGQYNVNTITSTDDVDSITGMPVMSNLPVELVKVPVAEAVAEAVA